ncbi:hypothetical protein [Pseudotabrizicola alkalilacus]|uniref:hypothetical protein n=1 Tax=Pseudotabrizicola alkalilacus TaxID=2305252 RepID=UPI0011C12658|nr:hypothetical protein [Pseudotabrizicola alkalilacus]
MKAKYVEALKHFEQIAKVETSTWPDEQWHGDIENCDICSRPMADETFMVDGPASKGGFEWGNLCVVCAYKSSPSVGWGKAQLYRRSEEGIWKLVAGGPPAEDMMDEYG